MVGDHGLAETGHGDRAVADDRAATDSGNRAETDDRAAAGSGDRAAPLDGIEADLEVAEAVLAALDSGDVEQAESLAAEIAEPSS